MPEAEAMPIFVTQVHALKSASGSLGAAEVSAEAAQLENAGKAGDMEFIRENLKSFVNRLTELVGNIAAVLKADVSGSDASHDKNTDPNIASHIPILQELSIALQEQKADDIDRILEELMHQPLDTKSKAALEEISDEVLVAEYDKAGEIIRSLLGGQYGN
jgi:HPt (histidine-containing phosphotransfer) domain-containing protein